jgi:hypothetical protein
LPGCPNAGSLRFQTCRFEKRDHLGVEFGIAVQNDVSVSARFGEGLAVAG